MFLVLWLNSQGQQVLSCKLTHYCTPCLPLSDLELTTLLIGCLGLYHELRVTAGASWTF